MKYRIPILISLLFCLVFSYKYGQFARRWTESPRTNEAQSPDLAGTSPTATPIPRLTAPSAAQPDPHHSLENGKIARILVELKIRGNKNLMSEEKSQAKRLYLGLLSSHAKSWLAQRQILHNLMTQKIPLNAEESELILKTVDPRALAVYQLDEKEILEKILGKQ